MKRPIIFGIAAAFALSMIGLGIVVAKARYDRCRAAGYGKLVCIVIAGGR